MENKQQKVKPKKEPFYADVIQTKERERERQTLCTATPVVSKQKGAYFFQVSS